MFFIRTHKGSYRGERCHVRAFKTSDAMYKFLNQGDNALRWRERNKECDPPAKAGIYAWAGGQWHNVKNLDPIVLAHI